MNPEVVEASDAFADIEYVVADDKRFVAKLGVGPEVYKSLRIVRGAGDAVSVASAAATGGAIAVSTPVATTFFAGSGWLSAIGLGSAAVTPIGWVVAAAVVSGGAYYGALRAYRAFETGLVDTIPRWINTPIDLFGTAIVDMLGGIALCVAQADGEICEAEREHIRNYFTNEWGIDRGYVLSALNLIERNLDSASLEERVANFAAFSAKNPDCKLDALRTRVEELLQALIASDGRIDAAEEHAIEAVMRELQNCSGGSRSLPDLRQTWLGRAVLGLNATAPKNCPSLPAQSNTLASNQS